MHTALHVGLGHGECVLCGGRARGRRLGRRRVDLRASADARPRRAAAPVTEAKVSAQTVTCPVRHLPRREQYRVRASRQEPKKRERQECHVKVAGVVVGFVHKVRDEDEDFERTPADGKHNHHHHEVLLATFFLLNVQFARLCVVSELKRLAVAHGALGALAAAAL